MPASRKRQAPELPALLSVAQAAALAGLSRDRCYRLAQSGALPGLVRLAGSRMLVRRAVLEAALRGEAAWPGDGAGDLPGGALRRVG